jgi:outer membrane protein assembly factor BamB
MDDNRPLAEWIEYRHDSALSGHQPVAGKISRPEIAWRHYLGGAHFDALPIALGERRGLLLLFGGCIHCFDIVGNLIWKSAPHGFEGVSAIADLDNDGREEIVAGNGKTLFVLDATNGAILWSRYLGPPAAAGFMHTAALVHQFPSVGSGMQIVVGLLSSNAVMVFDCTPGASRIEERHLLWMDDFFHPSILAVDIDGDGFDEIVVTKYSAIYSFDPATGRQKSVCRWSSGGTPKRNYGLFLAHDIGRRGAPGFLVLSEKVSKHISMIANDGAGNLSLMWDRFLEHIYPTDRKELHYTFNSLTDIDGDGEAEIIVSMFDESEETGWWLEVIDARSGEIRQRIDGLLLDGVQQTGSVPVICCTREKNRIPARVADAEIWQWRDRSLVRVHTIPGSSFAGRCARQSPVVTAFRADIPPSAEVWTIRLDGATALLMIDSEHRLSALQSIDGEWISTPIPSAIDVDAVLAVDDLDGDGRDEIVIADSHGEIRIIDLAGDSLGRIRGGMRFRYGAGAYYRSKPMQTPVVAIGTDGAYLAVPDGGSQIHLLKLAAGSGRPERLWSRDGRGRSGPEESFQSVGFHRADGSLGVMMSTSDGETAGLASIGIDGSTIWRHDVAGLPSARPFEHDRIGIHDYLLTLSADGLMLVVSGYRSGSMNSEETIGLRADDGRELWRRRTIGEGENGRGFGPWNAWSHTNVDGRSVVHFLAKDTVCAIDIASGEPLFTPWQLRAWNTEHLKLRGIHVDDFAAYGSLIRCELYGEGEPGHIIAGAYGGVGVIDSHGSMLWWLSAPLSTYSGACFGTADLDGDGRSEIAMSAADGDLIVVRADTGLEKWRLHLGEVATGIITCDIDGDGSTELIITTQQGSVLCIGVGYHGSGVVKWRVDLGYSLGAPIAADIDGNGLSEIVVVSGDGYIHAIRGRPGAEDR